MQILLLYRILFLFFFAPVVFSAQKNHKNNRSNNF